MLGRLSALLLGSFLAVTSNAIAEPMVMPIILSCDSEPGRLLNDVQKDYGEQPFFQGKGIFRTPDGEWNNTMILTLANPSSGTFSIIMVDVVSGAECLLMVGNELRPAG